MFFDVFLFILTHISLVRFFQESAEAGTRWSGMLNGHLMGSKNVGTKNY